MITAVLNEHLMPAELYNLAMIESGFVVHAESNAEAVGIWQFIPGTATRYGLHVDSLSDDRNHPLMATEAAARHLLDLAEDSNPGIWFWRPTTPGPSGLQKR